HPLRRCAASHLPVAPSALAGETALLDRRSRTLGALDGGKPQGGGDRRSSPDFSCSTSSGSSPFLRPENIVHHTMKTSKTSAPSASSNNRVMDQISGAASAKVGVDGSSGVARSHGTRTVRWVA